ncbi:MAG: M20 family peptidase [Pseudomonadales bacterium]
MMKKLLTFLGLALGLLATLLVVRTWLHQPDARDAQQMIEIVLDEQAIAERLAEAIRYRTLSNQNVDDLDAEAFEGFIEWVAQTYPGVQENLSLKRFGYTLLYRWQGRDPSLQPVLLTGHYDVVPVIPGTESKWQVAPFAGEIKDGIIWGRGALDDKSGVIGILEAVTFLLGQGAQPERTVYLSFGHDEEVGGSRGAGAVTQHLRDQGIQLAWSLDEGSFLFDGLFPGVEPLMAPINVAEKGSLTLDVVALAAGGHSSMPPSTTAVGKLAKAVTKLESNPVPGGLSGLSGAMFEEISRHMPFGQRLLFANSWLFSGILDSVLSQVTFANAMLRTTTAPTMLSGSVKTNVLPIEAIATVNFRIHPRDSVESVTAYVSDLLASDDIEIRPRGGVNASAVSSWESDGFTAIQKSLGEVHGDVVSMPGLMIAGSDSKHYGQVADDAYRFNPFTVTQADLTGFHGTNEKISVNNLANGVRAYIRILVNGAGAN